jgi:hypothetical protein
MSRDILKELYYNQISEAQAYEICDSVVGTDEFREPGLFGMDDTEWTAWGQGVGFVAIAKWRYEGWPRICPVCGREIEVKKFGWMAKPADAGHQLIHIPCLPGPSKQERQLYEEFRGRSVSGFFSYYEREVAISFAGRAAELNLAVLLVQGVIHRDERVLEAPEDLMCSCFEVPGETWEEFTAECMKCAVSFLENAPSREGLAFDFETESEEKWPKLNRRRKEIQREREGRAS